MLFILNENVAEDVTRVSGMYSGDVNFFSGNFGMLMGYILAKFDKGEPKKFIILLLYSYSWDYGLPVQERGCWVVEY